MRDAQPPLKMYSKREQYTDRGTTERNTFKKLPVEINTLESALLLINSTEEQILIAVFKNLAEFIRKDDENIEVLKQQNMLQLLFDKSYFIEFESMMVQRFALFIVTELITTINILQDYETEKTLAILSLCLQYYLVVNDDFCLEYLSVIIDKCLEDPKAALFTIPNEEFIDKFFVIMAKSLDPDLMYHSINALYKLLFVQKNEDRLEFTAHKFFPMERIICELNNEFQEIRNVTLKLMKLLILDTSPQSVFGNSELAVSALAQLTQLLCNNLLTEYLVEIVEVLASGMRSERMAQIYMEHNLFDKLVQCVNDIRLRYSDDIDPGEVKCQAIYVFAEIAMFPQFLYRLHNAKITEWLLECVMRPSVATHVILGLNRLMKYGESTQRIVEALDEGLILKLLDIMHYITINIRTREEAADFLRNILIFAFHKTASEMFDFDFPTIAADIFGESLPDLSIDFILTLLGIFENLAQNDEYRENLAKSDLLFTNIAVMLKNSFATTILVNNIFRCLTTLISEENVRRNLLSRFIIFSINRGLKSLSNVVKTAVTNFIMQTARFLDYVEAYIDGGVLETLIMHQKHSYVCTSTWNPAIEAILSKAPSLKFCIRNHLGFTDTTMGTDFHVSRKKIDDFRIFLNILHSDCSPMHPMYFVSFENAVNLPEYLVTVPPECFSISSALEQREPCHWCYSRRPADEYLPIFLDELNDELDRQNLVRDPHKVKRCIDFENMAKRASIVAHCVVKVMSENLKPLDLNQYEEECSSHEVTCHLKELMHTLHCSIIPLGLVRTGCQFERAILFKVLADQIGLPATLQRSVDGHILFNELPLPVEIDRDEHCEKNTMSFMPWRMLRPTHIVDLMFNVGQLYPLQSRQALQYLRLY